MKQFKSLLATIVNSTQRQPLKNISSDSEGYTMVGIESCKGGRGMVYAFCRGYALFGGGYVKKNFNDICGPLFCLQYPIAAHALQTDTNFNLQKKKAI